MSFKKYYNTDINYKINLENAQRLYGNLVPWELDKKVANKLRG